MSSDSLTAPAVLSACPGGDPGWLAGETLCNFFGVQSNTAMGSWQCLAIWITSFVMKEVPGYTAAAARWAQAVRGHDPEDADKNRWKVLTRIMLDTQQPPPTLVITQRRYVSVTATARSFDLMAGDAVDAIPGDWLESRVFNLKTLYQACLTKAQKWTPPQPQCGQIQMPPRSV